MVAQDKNSNKKEESPKTTTIGSTEIIKAGKNGNQVQKHLDVLTNQIGPRLTGSEGLQAACEWAKDKFNELGLQNVTMEKWGEFPVGFERGPAYGRVVEPKSMELHFGTSAWSAGTQGRVAGKVFLAPKTMKEFDKFKEQVDGAYILLPATPRSRGRSFGRRNRSNSKNKSSSKSKTEEKSESEKPISNGAKTNKDSRKTKNKESDDTKKSDTKKSDDKSKSQNAYAEYRNVYDAIMKLNPAGVIRSTYDERILTGGNYRVDWNDLPKIPSIRLLKKEYDTIKEMLDVGQEVKLEFDIRNHFRKGPIPLYNVIAEIPGTKFPEQCVIVGGHIDSWDGATGATDNAAGCATTIEAARILMAAKVKPLRTIRFMLWSGEEQGLLGSRAYVKAHKDELQKSVSAVFVHDGGTNYVAGIRCTEAMKKEFEKVFAAAFKLDERAPFEIQTVKAIYPRGGSDHTPFISVGIPGFFWSQRGRAVYRTTHHTQFDTFDTIVPEYQRHSSIVIALGAYGTANLDKLLPREGVKGRTAR